MILVAFFSGATMLGCVTAGLFFLRFWLKTKDRLFGAFSISFFLLAIERAVTVFWENGDDESVYVLRMAAFILLTLAIIDKNRNQAGPQTYR